MSKDKYRYSREENVQQIDENKVIQVTYISGNIRYFENIDKCAVAENVSKKVVIKYLSNHQTDRKGRVFKQC